MPGAVTPSSDSLRNEEEIWHQLESNHWLVLKYTQLFLSLRSSRGSRSASLPTCRSREPYHFPPASSFGFSSCSNSRLDCDDAFPGFLARIRSKNDEPDEDVAMEETDEFEEAEPARGVGVGRWIEEGPASTDALKGRGIGGTGCASLDDVARVDDGRLPMERCGLTCRIVLLL